MKLKVKVKKLSKVVPLPIIEEIEDSEQPVQVSNKLNVGSCGFAAAVRTRPEISKVVQRSDMDAFIKLQSAYLGYVNIPCSISADRTLVKLKCAYNRIAIKILDARKIGFDVNKNYSIEELLIKPVAEINVEQNKFPEPLTERCGVDVMFNLFNFLDFIQKRFNIVNINDKREIIAVINVPDLDNAYYNGSYMVFGTGKDMFTPLTCSDVIAHELSHGLIHSTCNLFYQGESGALNESISDCIACAFEFYLYDRYNGDSDNTNDIIGTADWFIGEDIAKTGKKMLRNMVNPSDCGQPNKYHGTGWINVTSNIDNGGVHINSGVPNKLFYLISLKIGIVESIQLVYRVMIRLGSKSNFHDYASLLCSLVHCENLNAVLESLEIVNLHSNFN